jgi:hypothetical protein
VGCVTVLTLEPLVDYLSVVDQILGY